MTLSQSTARALTDAELPFDLNVPLAKRVYWRVGGPADAVVTVGSHQALVRLQQVASKTQTPVFVLGKGSNLLISDAGIRGIVVLLKGELADTTATEGDRPQVTVGAGMPLVVLLSRAKKNGWTGLGCFAGIPGSVGGAVRMNAGSTLGETDVPLVHVDLVHRDGTPQRLTTVDLQMSYRTSHVPDGSIIATATFQTTGADADAEQAVLKTFLERRKATQPLHLPSCGSTFRNPPGDHAGRLIEVSGLKGYRVGGACVSEKHANFVVNDAPCTANDIRAVIEHVEDEVERQHGVRLQREVHFIGEWQE